MKGDVYNVKYDMTVLSYAAVAQKCITEVKDKSSKRGKFFTLFFKNITTTSVIIYKVETENLEQAKAYKRPADSDTNNHGWNKYTRQ